MLLCTSLLLYLAVSSVRANAGVIGIGVLLVAGSDLGLPSGMYALVIQLLFGGIDAVNVETGEKISIVPSAPGV
jgi:hypothetical protein